MLTLKQISSYFAVEPDLVPMTDAEKSLLAARLMLVDKNLMTFFSENTTPMDRRRKVQEVLKSLKDLGLDESHLDKRIAAKALAAIRLQ